MVKTADSTDARVEMLQRVIWELHGCRSSHLNTFQVREVATEALTWQAQVEEFQLFHHPRARRCFAWVAGGRLFAILESPIIRNALAAVKFARIAQSEALVNSISRQRLEETFVDSLPG